MNSRSRRLTLVRPLRLVRRAGSECCGAAARCGTPYGMLAGDPPSRSILGMRVDATTYGAAAQRIARWSQDRDAARYVCVANVHMTMIAVDHPDFRRIVNDADLVTSDGMPLVWMLRRLGVPGAERVYGPTLTLHVCEAAAREGVPIGLFGGTQESLAAMRTTMEQRYPGLRVAYAHAPPFRPLTPEEDDAVVRDILASGARILFVGLGCPKQERWMAAHKERLPLVQLGVGAAFDFHSGRVRQAPAWLQDRGLEWLFRLVMEPRRLWRRYLYNNPRFVILSALQLLGLRRFE